MKMTSRDKELVFLAVSLAIVAASWFGGAQTIKKKTKEVMVQKESLQKEYDERVRVLRRKEEYQKATKDYNEAYALMLTEFPENISQVQQIMFVTGIEEKFQTQVESVSYTDPAVIYEFQSLEPKHNDPYRLIQSTLEIPVPVTYEQWKDFLDYVFSYQDKNTIPRISAEYDEISGKVLAEVSLYQYAVAGEERSLKDPQITLPVGTDNIFRSSQALSYGGEKAERLEAIKKEHDCFVMLYPTASDVKAKVIAGADEERKVISESNDEEKLVIRAEEKGGRVSLTYSLGDKRPGVLNDLQGDTLDVYVLSTPRKGSTDLSGVSVTLENKTSRPMRIAVSGDDKSRPRFVVEKTEGDVEVISE